MVRSKGCEERRGREEEEYGVMKKADKMRRKSRGLEGVHQGGTQETVKRFVQTCSPCPGGNGHFPAVIYVCKAKFGTRSLCSCLERVSALVPPDAGGRMDVSRPWRALGRRGALDQA